MRVTRRIFIVIVAVLCWTPIARTLDAAETPPLVISAQSFPGAGPELLVDGRVDEPGSAWAAPGAPNWVEIDLGQGRWITEISVAPFIGSPGQSYFYNEAWTVQYRDGQGQLQHFDNVQKLLGAGNLAGPGITVTGGDPQSTSSIDSYKYYGFTFDPVSTRFIRFTVTAGDRDGDSNGAEIELREAFPVGSPVTLKGSASDAEDGNLSNDIHWRSDLTGYLGTGSPLIVSDLPVGTHTITAEIEDSLGAPSSTTTSITIIDTPVASHSLDLTLAGSGSGEVSSSPAGIACGSDCNESYEDGTVVTLTATPAADSEFTGWSGDADCSDGQITMAADHSCTATFDLAPPATFSLLVSKTGSGLGRVSSVPAGIDCGGDCSETYEDGTVVSLTATPEPGSSFVAWSGHSDCLDGQITMAGNRSCSAQFDLRSFPLTVSRAGNGSGSITSSPAGISCGSDCSENYEFDTTVTLNAAPGAGSTFAGWSGDADCGDGSVNMSGARSCTATFNLEKRTLSLNRAGTGSGTVTSNPAGISCGADCAEAYDHGTTVALTAAAAQGSIFVGWSGAADCGDGSVTMTTDLVCTATFEPSPPDFYTLKIFKTGSGTGTVTSSPAGIACGADCIEDFEEGTTVTLSANPAAGATFAGWSGDADCADGSLSMTQAKNCTATFEVLPPSLLTLKVFKTGAGTGTVTSSPAGIDCGTDCIEDFEEGTTVTLSADPAPGATFGGWSGDADCADGSVTLSQALDCVATFELSPPATHSLSVTKGGTGGGTVTSTPAGINCGADCSEDFAEGTVVALTPTPAPDSAFSGWSGAADCSDGSVTVIADSACTANFDLLPPRKFKLTTTKEGTGTGRVTSSPNGIDCGEDCSEDYDEGTSVSLAAIPANGSAFAGWSGAEDCSDGQVTMSDARDCRAIFKSQTLDGYVLTVQRSGSGAGVVSSSPAGIDCGTDCTHVFSKGTPVALAAVAEDGSVFAGWSGDNDCRDGEVTLRGSRDCEAIFESLGTTTRTLSIDIAGGGTGFVTSSPAGIDCGSDCLQNFPSGTVVTLTAAADNGSYFAGWSGSPDCQDGEVDLDVDEACTATFEPQPPNTQTLTIQLNGTGSGTVISTPAGIDCGYDCTYNFEKGITVDLTAVAAAGSQFSGWSGPGDCRSGQVTIRNDRTCTATFDDARAMFTDGFDSGTTDKWRGKKP